MATSNIILDTPARGSDVGTWDIPINANASALDGYLGGVQSIPVAGADIVLTAPTGAVTPGAGPTQAQNAVLRFSGAMTANVTVTLPLPGYYIIENLTTAAFVLSFKAAAAGEIIATEQGSQQHVFSDGANVRFVNLPPVGTYLDICDATVPAWITACTKPPYLNCDGGAIDAGKYPFLAAKLGMATAPDLRGRTRAALNQGVTPPRITMAGGGINGDTRFAAGGSDGVALTADQLAEHAHANTLTQSPHAHAVSAAVQVAANGIQPGNGAPVCAAGTVSTAGANANISINNANAGGGMPHPNMQPTLISGITLIRAA